ncbi:MAG: 4a-hydroxytetrahydrobiopterin dehydratase [Opitutales bacterium]
MNGMTEAEQATALSALPGWAIEEQQLCKTYKMASFRDAIVLLQRVAFEVEDLNHHPEIWNLYNRVRFALSTHDAGDVVTESDFALANKIETLAARLGGK